MTTRRLRVLAAAILPWMATASLLAAPIGRPTPPPCSAEGACVPYRPTWGYTQTQWRLWPGTTLDERGEAAESKIGGGDIGDTDPPDAEHEDRLAPPTVEALEPEPAPRRSEEETPGVDLPTEDELERPERPADPPASDPSDLPEFMREQPGDMPSGEQPSDPSLPFGQPPSDIFPGSSRAPTGPRFGGDAPPPLPLGIRPGQMDKPQRMPAPRAILPASATTSMEVARPQVSLIPAEAKPTAGVQQAGGDTPPAMPRGLFNRR